MTHFACGDVVFVVQPTFHPGDTPSEFVWRIRNLQYPRSVYQLAVDEAKEHLILRTTNKKYFKKWAIPALRRLGLKVEAKALAASFSPGTLLVKYAKPPAVLEAESKRRKEISDKLAASGSIAFTT